MPSELTLGRHLPRNPGREQAAPARWLALPGAGRRDPGRPVISIAACCSWKTVTTQDARCVGAYVGVTVARLDACLAKFRPALLPALYTCETDFPASDKVTGMASGMEQFQEKARQAWTWTRAQALRVGSAAWARAVALYRRGHAHLMTLPPVRRALVLGLWSFLAVLALLTFYMLLLIPLTPSIHDLRQARAAAPSTMVSADGKELARFDQGLQERVTLKQISPNVISALISTEDHRFYDHHGVDFTRTAGAILHTASGNPQGGSTITQQLARNMFPEEIGRSRNLNRKLKELITALKIEATYSKTEILEAYLNTVPFLYNTYGIEMAARTYFDKPRRASISSKAPPWRYAQGTITTICRQSERSLRAATWCWANAQADVIDEARYKSW